MAKRKENRGGFKVKGTKKMEHEFGKKHAKRRSRKHAGRK
jgi:hypothetical protein